MSADRWIGCPQCKATKIQEAEKHLSDVLDTFGQGDAEEFVVNLTQAKEDLARAKKYGTLSDQCRLREDYEVGIDQGGNFDIHYRGRCQDCGFGTEFKYSEALEIKT